MNPVFEKMNMQEALDYNYIGNKKAHHRFQLFFCFLKNNIDEPDLLSSLKKLMEVQKIQDLNSLRHTDKDSNLLMLSSPKVGFFLLENNLIDINATDRIGNTFLFYVSHDLIKKIDGKFSFEWKHINNDGENLFSYSGLTGHVVIKKLEKAREHGVNANHVNKEGLTAIDHVLLHRMSNQARFMKLTDLVKVGCSFYGIKHEHMIPEDLKKSLVKHVSVNEKRSLDKLLKELKVEPATKVKKRI